MFPNANVQWTEAETPDTQYEKSPVQLDAETVLEMAKLASDRCGNVDPSLVFKALVQVVYGTMNWS